MNNLKYIVEGNWDEIKGKVQKQWGKLTDEKINEINGSYTALVGELKKLYGYTASEIEEELAKFSNSAEFEKLKENVKNKLYDFKSVMVSALDEYFQSAKQKSTDAGKAMSDCVSAHPFKSIGIAAFSGLLLGYFCKKKK